MRNGAVIVAALGMFAVTHSLLAGRGIKPWLKGRFGERAVEGWYRLAYNVLAVVLLLPAAAAYLLLPDRTLYALGLPWSALLRVVQVGALVGLVVSVQSTDLWAFAGLRQAAAYLRGERLPLPVEPLQQGGMYRYVRHPLYFFSLLLIWANPRMSLNMLLVNSLLTLYILVGSVVEERRLLRIYGAQYRAYQQSVSWLLPLPPRSDDGDVEAGSATIQSR